MDGIGILLKALGIEINPEEVKQAVAQAQILLPKIAQQFEEMNSRLKDIEIRLSKSESYIPNTTCVHCQKHLEGVINGTN